MYRDVPKETLPRQRDEVGHGQRGIDDRELEFDGALVGIDERMRRERRGHERPPLRVVTGRPAVAGRMASSSPVTFCSRSSVALGRGRPSRGLSTPR